MSLVHWWPLNGNLRDYVGCNHLKITNNNNKLQSNDLGLLGKCWERTTVGTTDILRSTNKMAVFTEQSICAWIYVSQHAATDSANGVVSNHSHNDQSGLGIGVFVSKDDTTKYYVSINAGCRTDRIHSSASGRGRTNIKGAWHHVCITYASDKKIRLYVDGIEDMTPLSYNVYSISDYLDVFNWSTTYYTNTNYRPVCKVCDVRVYDHALSVAEVKELSKGLMIHYAFNDMAAEPTTNVGNNASWSTYGSYWTLNERTGDGLKITRPSSSISDCVAIQNSTITSQMAQGDIWTFSCFLYKNGQPWKSTASGISSENYGYRTISWESRSDGYYRITFKVISSPGAWVLHNYFFSPINKEVQCELRYMQFEKKDHATPYTVGSRTYTTAFDDSGNGYDATAYNMTVNYDTNNGTLAAKFNGSTSYYEVPVPRSNMFSTPYTLSFWVNPDDDGRAIYFGDHSTSGGVSMNFERKSGGAFRYYHGGNPDKEISGLTAPVGEWTMITVTSDGSTMKFYKNGTEVSNSAYTFTPTITKSSGHMRIGRDNRSDSTALAGRISDFRWYATALSSDDVKILYESKAAVDKSSNFYTNEFTELNTTNVDITKKFTIKTNEIIESQENGFYKDGHMTSNTIYEI